MDLGNAAKEPGVRVSPGVAQRAFPVHAVQHPAGDLGSDGESTMASVSAVAVGGGMLEPPALPPTGGRAARHRDAYHQKDHSCAGTAGEHAAQQCGGRADGKPDKVILKVLASSARKPTAAASQRMGNLHGMLHSLCCYYTASPWGRSRAFTGTLHRKQNIDKNGKKP